MKSSSWKHRARCEVCKTLQVGENVCVVLGTHAGERGVVTKSFRPSSGKQQAVVEVTTASGLRLRAATDFFRRAQTWEEFLEWCRP